MFTYEQIRSRPAIRAMYLFKITYILEQENKNTRAKTNRDVKLLIDLLRQRGEPRNPKELPPEELNGYLSEFIECKKKDGGDYEPSSLRGFISSFHRHLKEPEYSANIIENIAFEQTRDYLQARCKKFKKELQRRQIKCCSSLN